MDRENVRRSWIARLSGADRYCAAEALADTLALDAGLGAVRISRDGQVLAAVGRPVGANVSVSDQGQTLEVQFASAAAPDAWDQRFGEIVLAAGDSGRSPSEVAAMDGLARLLRAFWGEAAPAAGLFELLPAHFAFYARGLQGGASSDYGDGRTLPSRNLPEPWLKRVGLNVKSGLPADKLSAGAEGQLCERIPWSMFGSRFGRLAWAECEEPASLEVKQPWERFAWGIERCCLLRLSRSSGWWRALRESLIPIRGEYGAMGALSLCWPPGEIADRDLVLQLARGVAARIGARWVQQKAGAIARQALSAAAASTADPGRPDSAPHLFWEQFREFGLAIRTFATLHLALGEPVALDGIGAHRQDGDIWSVRTGAGCDLALPHCEPHNFNLKFGSANLKIRTGRWGDYYPNVSACQEFADYLQTALHLKQAERLGTRGSPRLAFRMTRESNRWLGQRDAIDDLSGSVRDLATLDNDLTQAAGRWLTPADGSTFFQALDGHLRKLNLLGWTALHADERFADDSGLPAPLQDIVVRAFLVAAVHFYGGWIRHPAAPQAPVFHLDWNGRHKFLPQEIETWVKLAPADLAGAERFSMDDLLRPVPLELRDLSDLSVAQSRPVRFALEEAFLTAMKDCDPNGPFDIRLEENLQANRLQRLQVSFPCASPHWSERQRNQWQDVEGMLRYRIAWDAQLTCTQGKGRATIVLHFGGKRRSLASLLTHEMRFEEGDLHHHVNARGENFADRWPDLKLALQESESLWDPKENRWCTEPVRMGDAIESLCKDSFVKNDIQPDEAFDVMCIWDQFRKMSGGSLDRVILPEQPPLDKGRLFFYAPEWYEILLGSGDSLLSSSQEYRPADGTVRLALDPGRAEGIKPESDAYIRQNGHEFRLYFADDGPGIQAEDFRKSLTEARAGHNFRGALARAAKWCGRTRLYSKNANQREIHEFFWSQPEKEPERRDNLYWVPSDIRAHFATSGICVEFIFQIRGFAEPADVPLPEDQSGPQGIGVAVVDLARHDKLGAKFREHRFTVFPDWADFDAALAEWDYLLVHLSDYSGNPSKILALISCQTQEPQYRDFAERGKRVLKKIVVFTDGTGESAFDGLRAECHKAQVLDRALFTCRHQTEFFAEEFRLDKLGLQLVAAIYSRDVGEQDRSLRCIAELNPQIARRARQVIDSDLGEQAKSDEVLRLTEEDGE